MSASQQADFRFVCRPSICMFLGIVVVLLTLTTAVAAKSEKDWFLENYPAINSALDSGDFATAERLLRQGAEDGFAAAEFMLGQIYSDKGPNQNCA